MSATQLASIREKRLAELRDAVERRGVVTWPDGSHSFQVLGWRDAALLFDLLAAETRRADRAEKALRQIADDPEAYPDGCPCGHRLSMCHRVNANTWCGGTMAPAIARAALAAAGAPEQARTYDVVDAPDGQPVIVMREGAPEQEGE